MVSSPSTGVSSSIDQLVTNVIERGVLSRREHLQLTATMLSGANLTPAERHHINQIFDSIRSGRMQLAD